MLFYLLPFVSMLVVSLGFIFGAAFTLPINDFVLFVFVHLLFILSLSAVAGNVLIETALCFFEDIKNSSELRKIYEKRVFVPIKPLVFVIIFIGIYIYLASDFSSLSAAKLGIMVLPSFALLINSKYFISERVRFISGKYLAYNKRFHVMLSHTVSDGNKIEFITVEGEPFETDAAITDIDYKAFCEECRKNGLNAPEKQKG